MTTTVLGPAATTTRFGWWLGQAVRLVAAALMLGGLLGAALGAARTSDVGQLHGDLDAGRVAEIEFPDGGGHQVPTVGTGDDGPTVRWKVVGAGWRQAPLPPGDLSAPLGETDGQDARAEIEQRAAAAGVPVSYSASGAAHDLVGLAMLTSLVLLIVLIGGPQPRWATKWAWFWLLLVPGGLAQLVWIATEAPWSSRANRQPEPLPHGQQPDDRRLTGGRALLISIVLGALLTVAGTALAGWLAG